MLIDHTVLNPRFTRVAMLIILIIEGILFCMLVGTKVGLRHFVEFGALIMPLSWIEMVWPKIDLNRQDVEWLRSRKRKALMTGMVVTIAAQLVAVYLVVSHHVFSPSENMTMMIGAVIIAAITFFGIQRTNPFGVPKT